MNRIAPKLGSVYAAVNGIQVSISQTSPPRPQRLLLWIGGQRPGHQQWW